MYKVIKDFTDLQDNRHVYHAGDSFPRDGVKVSAERVDELASVNNARGEALIVAQEAKIQPVRAEKTVADKSAKSRPKRTKKEK